MFCQCTLAESVAAVGIGLHSGRKIRLVLHPAPEDSGICLLYTSDAADE